MQNQKTDFAKNIQKRLAQLRDTFDRAVTLPIEGKTEVFAPYLVFKLGQEQFSILSTHIREIVVNHNIVRLPGNNSDLCGVINYRNTVLSVLDLHQILKVSSRDDSPGRILIISKGLKLKTSFLVNTLTGFVSVDENRIKPKPFSLDPAIGKLIKGVYYHQDQMITLLDPDFLAG